MPEKCVNSPDRECRSATRLALLEKRVEDLETGQSREEQFRKDYYQDREERNLRQQRLESKIAEIDGKLDKVVEYQEAQQAKPGKRWDAIVEKVILLVVGAVVGLALVRLGLSA